MSKTSLILMGLAAVLTLGMWMSFKTPAREPTSALYLNTSGKYISALDWPPKLEVLDEPFSCTEAGNPEERAGQSRLKSINGRSYCVTEVANAAAGTKYTQYAYATEINGKTAILTFSTRSSNCENYAENDEKLSCIAEQELFNPDPYIDELVDKQISIGTKNVNEDYRSGELRIEIKPSGVLQGDPALVTIEGFGTSTVRSLSFNGKSVQVFDYKGKPAALLGFDLKMAPGTYPLKLALNDDRRLDANVRVGARVIAREPLGIPDKLGGDTPESEKELINTLVQEGALISSVPSASERLWDGEFAYPLKGEITITDTYGYSRLTGASTISHKGTDFRAAIGTPVFALNSGKVVFTRELRNYGKTVIIDHGLGLHTIYMHLSEISVPAGKSVEKGENIGKSGDTGYVLGPHLHLSIRINGVSIDPEKFLKLFNSD